MHIANKYLHIQGFVCRDTLKRVLGSYSPVAGNHWFFVEYAPVTFSVGTTFNIIVEDTVKNMFPEFYQIKLIDVLDQFGNHLEEISAGWKAMCCFSMDTLPALVAQLPQLTTWQYNEKGVKFLNHSDIVVDDNNMLIRSAYTTVLEDMYAMALHSNVPLRSQFIHSLWGLLKENKDEIGEKVSSDFVRKVEIAAQSVP